MKRVLENVLVINIIYEFAWWQLRIKFVKNNFFENKYFMHVSLVFLSVKKSNASSKRQTFQAFSDSFIKKFFENFVIAANKIHKILIIVFQMKTWTENMNHCNQIFLSFGIISNICIIDHNLMKGLRYCISWIILI